MSNGRVYAERPKTSVPPSATTTSAKRPNRFAPNEFWRPRDIDAYQRQPAFRVSAPHIDFTNIPIHPPEHGRPDASHGSSLAPEHAPQSLALQAKLEIGAVDDPLEKAADAAADRVMRMHETASATGFGTSAPGGALQRSCAACEQDETLQRKPVGSGVVRSPVPPLVNEVLRSPGERLDAGTRAFMEPRFGHGFGGVRVHVDAQAAESAAAVRARAYTVGRHVVFAAGRYAPATPTGKRLLAHELAHVMQQHEDGEDALQQVQRVDDPQSDGDVLEQEDSASDGDTEVQGLRTDNGRDDRTDGVMQLEADDARPQGQPPKKTTARLTIVKIDVHQDTQSMTVTYSDGSTETHAVSTGRGLPDTKDDPCKTQKETNCTPNGSFTITTLGNGDTKNPEGDAMSWYAGFVDNRGIGIHDSQPVPGVPHSHGCVRVGDSPADDAFAKKINTHVVVGKTTVIVSGKAPTKRWSKPKRKPKPKGGK